MATDIATLTIEVDSTAVVRAQQNLTGLATAGQSAAAVATQTERAFAGFSKVMAGLGIAVGGAAFGAFIRGAINSADAASKLSQKIGTNITEVAGLQLAFQLSGLEAGALQQSMSRLSNGLANGSKALTVMGISSKNADGSLKSTRQALGEVADKFVSYQDGAQKSALAMGLFGIAGADMIPLLNGGASALDEFDKTAERLGLTISEKTAKEAGAFNDSLDLVSKGVEGIGARIAADLLPTLSGLAGQFLETTTSGDKLKNVAGFLSASLKLLYISAVGVVEVFSTVGQVIGGVSAAIVAALSGNFSQATDILKDLNVEITTGWKDTLSQITGAWNATGNAAVESLAAADAGAKRAAPSVSELGKKTKAVADEYKKLMQSIQEKIALQNAELENEGQLTDAEKLRIQTTFDLAKAKRVLTSEEKKRLDASIEQFSINEKSISQQKSDLEWGRKTGEENIKTIEAIRAKTDALKGQLDASKFEIQTIGKTATEIAKLEAAKLNDAATTADRNALIAQDIDLSGELSRKYSEQAATLRDLARSKVDSASGKEAFEAEKKRLDDIKEEWKKTTDSINNSLTDALMRGFESGKGFAENLRDTLKNMFKTLILRPVISAVVNPVSQGIGSLFGGGGSSGGGFGSLFSGFGNFGSGIGAGFSAARGESGFGGAFSAAGTALGAGNIAGGIGTGLGALGAAMPYVAAAVALYSMVKHKKTPHLGSAVNTTLSGAATTDRSDYLAGNYNAETDSALRFLTLGSVGSLNKLDTMFGGAGGFTANAKFAADGKDDSAADATIFRGGREVSALAGEGYKLYAPNAEEAFKAFTKDFEGLTLSAIKSLQNLPDYAKAEFDKLGDSATTEGIGLLVDQIGQFQSQLSSMKAAIGSLGSASDSALASIINSAGGIQQFSAAVDSYYQNFYSDAERLAFSTTQVSDAFNRLGVTMPTTRKDFRDLVESIDTTSDSGQNLYSSLLSLSSSFAAVVPAAAEVKAALVETITSVVAEARAAAFTPLPSQAGTYVQNGVSYTVGNLNDIGRAAQSTGDQLQSATASMAGFGDAILNEIDRIRGVLRGEGPQGQAAALGQFTTLNAQARAGDSKAIQSLPNAAKAFEEIARLNASTKLEADKASAYVLATLEQTASVLGLGSGARPVGIGGGSSTISLPGASASGPGHEAMLAELKALRTEVAALRTATETGNSYNKRTSEILRNVTPNGDAVVTEAA